MDSLDAWGGRVPIESEAVVWLAFTLWHTSEPEGWEVLIVTVWL